MRYLHQIIFDLRQQPLLTWLSVIGTAIAIALLMSDYMLSNIHNISLSPESNRTRILYGYGAELSTEGGAASGLASIELSEELYSNLDGVECVSYSDDNPSTFNVNLPGRAPVSIELRSVDENYWKIYDYQFLEGSPFSKEEVESGIPVTILSQSTAEHLLGKEKSYLGKEIMIDNSAYRITGIIKDVHPLLTNSHSAGFVTHTSQGMPEDNWNIYLGSYSPILLMKPGISADHIRRQVEDRYRIFNKKHASDGFQLVYHNQPWTTEERNSDVGTNSTPDLTAKHRTTLIECLIILLIPAINLATMTRSRMRKRVSEIGLRRAFGCTRARIMADLLSENFIISLFGGLIGLILSIIFITGFSNYFISYASAFETTRELMLARPSLAMLFNWWTFGLLLLLCFLFNLLSAGIPALKASLIKPAEAISGHNIHK